MSFKIKKFRMATQIFFLMLVTLGAFRHQVVGGGPQGAPNTHTICPFGGIEAFYGFFTKGEFIKKLYYSNIVLFVATVVLVIVMARYFCAWICALGTMQEIFGKIGKKIFKKRYEIPETLDGKLRYLKYFVLVAIIYFTWRTGELVVNSYDPFAAYAHIPAGIEELLNEYWIGFSVLILSLAASMFFDRFFCKYACPLGAFLGIMKKISFYKLERNESSCINCGKCSGACPVNIKVSELDKIKSSECINCLECMEACPTKPNSISAKIHKKIVKPSAVFVGGLVIYVGIIGGSRLLGYWEATPSSVEEIIKTNPENIRGWMTLSTVSYEFEIPLEKLYKRLGIKMEELSPDITLKDAEKVLQEKGIEFDHGNVGNIVKGILEENGVEVAEAGFQIKGSMSIESISSETGIEEAELISRFGLPENFPIEKPLKEVKEKYGFEINDLNEKLGK